MRKRWQAGRLIDPQNPNPPSTRNQRRLGAKANPIARALRSSHLAPKVKPSGKLYDRHKEK